MQDEGLGKGRVEIRVYYSFSIIEGKDMIDRDID